MKRKKTQHHKHKEHTRRVQIDERLEPDQSLPALTQDELDSVATSTLAPIDASLAEDELDRVVTSDLAPIDASLAEDEQEIMESSDDDGAINMPTEDDIDGFDAIKPPETPEIVAAIEDSEAPEDAIHTEETQAVTATEETKTVTLTEDPEASTVSVVTEAIEVDRSDDEQYQTGDSANDGDIVTQPLEKAPVVRHAYKTPVEKTSIAFTYILLAMIVLLSFMFWHATSVAHLYTNTLDSHTGAVLAQREISSFPISATLTTPTRVQSSLLVGIQDTNTQNEQHVLALQGNDTAWQVQKTVAVPFVPTSISSAPDGSLFVEGAEGMQVLSTAGVLRWQLHSPQPTQGAHPFQPASDEHTVYTLLAGQSPQVAAYDLQNGAQRWAHTLNDTVGYAAPLLLDDHTLYIASDHTLYALSSDDGSIRWVRNFPARTLLLENEGQVHLLVAASSQGLVGLNPSTGINVWTFRSLPGNTITPAQFYQASLGKPAFSTHQIVYTTGVVWQMPQVQEQVWLYAIDATKGTLLWSQTIASGIVSTDAGRFFMPILDASQAIVVLQQQIDGATQRIEAFDANNGQRRWSQLLTGISHSTSSLLVMADGSLLLLTTTSDLPTILHAPTVFLAVPLMLSVLSVACLLLLFLLTFPQRKRWLSAIVHTLASGARSQVEELRRRFLSRLPLRLSRRQIALVALLGVVSVSVPAYFWLNQPQARVYQLATGTGTTQWQTNLSSSVTVLEADAQGSIVVASEGANQHQLQALNNDGTVRWHMFNTEGSFFLPDVATQPGTLLVALSGHTTFSYQGAPDDPAYPRLLDHLLTLYLLDRNTGTPLWQHIEVYPDDQQSATILGSDANYIYISSIQANLLPGSARPTVQLLGINQASGTIDWRVFGPSLPNSQQPDNGKLFLRSNQAIWQVAGTVYAIDTSVGQIAWRRPIMTDPPALEVQEEGEMTQIANFLLVTRSGSVHALDLASGNEVWTIASTGAGGISDTQTPTKVIVAAQTVLIGKQAQLYAFNGLSRQLLWDQRLTGPIQQLRASSDGKMVYAITAGQNNLPQLLAIDMQTGTIRWQFTQSEQFAFFNAGSDGFQYRAGHLLVSTCYPSQNACRQQRLYILDGNTGRSLWNIAGSNLANIHISSDGTTVALGITRSTWADLVAHFP